MALFYFHYISNGQRFEDAIGTEFISSEHAYMDACQSALQMSVDKLKKREDPSDDCFELSNDKGDILFYIPFSEVLQPSRILHPSSLDHELKENIANARKALERNRLLISEIRSISVKTKLTIEDVQKSFDRRNVVGP